MKNENEMINDLLLELEETDKVSAMPEGEGPYSITVDYGQFFTLFCCPT